MKKMAGKIRFLAAVLLLLAGIGVLSDQVTKRETVMQKTASDERGDKTQIDVMEVHFIDVGQGAATLVICGDAAMLIDAGDDTKGTAIQNYLNKQGITRLDYLILTHPDADHIGSAPVVITKYDIDRVFMSNFEKDNQTYRKLIQALDDKRLSWSTPEIGSSYTLGSATITIAGPVEQYEDPNNASIVFLLQHGENRFLFSGDAEEEAEKDIVAAHADLAADVYQAGHHGSRTSSTIAWMQAVNPTYAVISCEEGNRYGHPHAEVLNRFRERGILVFRTDEQGSIVAASDGTAITWNCAPSDTWQAGEPAGSDAVGQQAAEQTEITQSQQTVAEGEAVQELTYVLNIKTKKFHKPECSYLPTTNRLDASSGREEIVAQGYDPCKKCNP